MVRIINRVRKIIGGGIEVLLERLVYFNCDRKSKIKVVVYFIGYI